MKKTLAIELLLALTMLTSSANAAGRKNAEPNEAGSESALIKKGLDLRQKGKDEEALKEFRRAYEMATTGRALAQIALAEQALGRWVDAERHLADALTHMQESWISHNKKHLDQALDDIQGHIGSLDLSGEAKDGTVKIDGVAAATLPLNAPLRVPAGSVALEVQAPGYLPIFRNVVVPARGLAREHLSFVAVAQTTTPAPPPPPVAATVTTETPKPLAPASAWGAGKTVGVVLGVAAIGALGTGIAFHIAHESKAKSYKNDGCQSDTPSSDCQSRYDSINTAKYITIAGYIGAAVLGGVATYLLLSGPSAPADKVATAQTGLQFQCSPTVGLGVACAGRF
jgi:hypothetical protein